MSCISCKVLVLCSSVIDSIQGRPPLVEAYTHAAVVRVMVGKTQ